MPAPPESAPRAQSSLASPRPSGRRSSSILLRRRRLHAAAARKCAAPPASAAAQPIRRCAGSWGRPVCMTRCCTRKQAVNLLLHSTPRSALVLGHAAAAWTRGVDLMSSQVEARLSDRRLGEITSGLKGAITALLAGDSPTIPPRASPLRDPRLANDAND